MMGYILSLSRDADYHILKREIKTDKKVNLAIYLIIIIIKKIKIL